jgi:hypothetical protein
MAAASVSCWENEYIEVRFGARCRFGLQQVRMCLYNGSNSPAGTIYTHANILFSCPGETRRRIGVA